jgi:8-oxo-dGTP pyrophosphatase MutT (NUDIX family)
VPAGKLEKNEAPEEGARRELFEETGIYIEHPSHIQFLGSLYIRKTELDYVYHYFKVKLEHQPEIHLSNEHQSYKWASSEDLERLPLIAGAEEALKIYRARIRLDHCFG